MFRWDLLIALLFDIGAATSEPKATNIGRLLRTAREVNEGAALHGEHVRSLRQVVDEERQMFALDCNETEDDWQVSWSSMKKEWCCLHMEMGCPSLSCVITDAWEESWSSHKKKWCCEHEHVHVACPVLYDCQEGLSDSAASWTQHKLKWCCANQGLGCWESSPTKEAPQETLHRLFHVTLLLKNINAALLGPSDRLALQGVLARNIATAAGIDPQYVFDLAKQNLTVSLAGQGETHKLWWPHECPIAADDEYAPVTLVSSLARLSHSSSQILLSAFQTHHFARMLDADMHSHLLEHDVAPIEISCQAVAPEADLLAGDLLMPGPALTRPPPSPLKMEFDKAWAYGKRKVAEEHFFDLSAQKLLNYGAVTVGAFLTLVSTCCIICGLCGSSNTVASAE